MARYTSYRPRSLRKKQSRTQKRLVVNIIIGILILYFLLNWGLPALVGGLSFLNKFKSSPTAQTLPIDTLAPPVLNIPYEATNSALISISGYASANTKVKIYLDDELKTTADTKDDGSFASDTIPLTLGINNIYGKTVGGNNQESLPSKTIQLTYSNDKPKLDVASPSDNSQVKGGDKKVSVSGDTDPNNSVSINGTTVIVNSDGHFNTSFPINDGDNNIVIVATNSVGNTTSVSRKVTYSAS